MTLNLHCRIHKSGVSGHRRQLFLLVGRKKAWCPDQLQSFLQVPILSACWQCSRHQKLSEHGNWFALLTWAPRKTTLQARCSPYGTGWPRPVLSITASETLWLCHRLYLGKHQSPLWKLFQWGILRWSWHCFQFVLNAVLWVVGIWWDGWDTIPRVPVWDKANDKKWGYFQLFETKPASLVCQ